MKLLNVGIIGVGMAFERLHYPAFEQLKDQYKIVALCDIDQEKSHKWAEKLQLNSEHDTFDNWQDMLARKDLDVIDIMVPIELNYKITEAVANRVLDKHIGIICEKPLAPTLKQAKAARDLAKKNNIPIMIAENYRYNEEMNKIRDLVRNKHVGDIIYFIQNRVDNFPEKMLKDTFQAKEWRQHPEYPGGSLTDSALHDIAGLRHIFGGIDKLQAFGHLQQADYSSYSVINVNLLFKSGITGQFSFYSAGKEMQRPLTGLRIFGTKGMIYLEEKSAGIINVAHNDGHSEQLPYKPEMGYYNELLNFYNALTGKETIGVTPEMEYGDLLTINNILTSLKEQRIVTVDDSAMHQSSYQENSSIGAPGLH